MERNRAIDAVKGFAILLVMVGHCIVLNGLNETDPYIYDAIKSVQMPLFMLVSGVVAAYFLRKNGKGSGLNKLPRRAVSYLVPFFSWFVLVYLWTHLLSKSISFWGFLEELKLLLFQTDRGLWFLMTLFVVTLCVMSAQAIADKVCGAGAEGTKKPLKKMCLFLLLSFAFYLFFFFQSRSGNSFLSPSLTVQYFPFYLLGYVGNGYLAGFFAKEKSPGQKGDVIAWVICIVTMIFFVWLVIAYDLTAPVDGIKTLALQMTASLLGTVSVYGIVYKTAEKWQKKSISEKSKKIDKKDVLSVVGTYTLEIYVLHFRFARILGLAEKNLQFYSPEGLLWLLAAFILMSVLTALCIWLIKKVKILDLILFGKIR